MNNNPLLTIIDLLAEFGRLALEDKQTTDGATLAGQPSAGSETTTEVDAHFDSTMLEGEI